MSKLLSKWQPLKQLITPSALTALRSNKKVAEKNNKQEGHGGEEVADADESVD